MQFPRPLAVVLLFSLSIAGCPKKDDASKPSDQAEKSKQSDKDDSDKAKAKKKEDQNGKPSDDDDKDGPKAKSDDKPDDKPTPMPERSKVPTFAELASAKDAKSTGNDRGCEVRTLREWVRVSCRKAGPDGSLPSGVIVTRGKSKETYLFSKSGVTSIVTPLLPGTDLQAKFSWTDVVYSVSIRWGKTEPQPDVVAHFVQTDDKPTALTGAATCTCMKKIHAGSQCVETDENWQITSVNPWCEASYGDDCEKLVECARGEPGRMPQCPTGFKPMYPGNSCLEQCTDKCSGGLACVEYVYDPKFKVCMEP